MKWKTEKRKISDLKECEYNPRQLTKKQYKDLKKSLDKFGLCEIPVINTDNTIIAGHQRIKILKEKSPDAEIEVRVPSKKLNKEQFDEYLIRSNKNTGEWDFDTLANSFEMDALYEFGFEPIDFGFDVTNLEPEETKGDDDVPQTKSKTITVKGDLYELGEHRLLCGDSTMIDDVEKLMDGQKADMVFTDPPYNQETEGGFKSEIGQSLKKQSADIEHLCNFEPEKTLEMIPDLFNKNTLNCFLFCNKDLVPNYLNWAQQKRYSFNILVWKKPSGIPIGGSYTPDIEYMLVFRKSAIFNRVDNAIYSKVMIYGRETGLHPTMKPIDLITNQLQIASNKNSLVVDLFLGSGSTLIACEKTKRKCYGMELDPKYCDVIVKRYIDFCMANNRPFSVKRNGKEIGDFK